MRSLSSKNGFVSLILLVILILGIASFTTYTVITNDSVDVITGNSVSDGLSDNTGSTMPTDGSNRNINTANSNSVNSPTLTNTKNPTLELSQTTKSNETQLQIAQTQKKVRTTINYYRRGGGGSSSSNIPSTKTRTKTINNVGTIEFSTPIDKNVVNTQVIIEPNLISIPSTSLANVPAKLTLSNLQFSHSPFPLQDGLPCTDCSIIESTPTKLIFDVLHFTNYSAGLVGQLTIFDIEDIGNEIYVRSPTKFFANYSNIASGIAIDNTSAYNGSCAINFDSQIAPMIFNNISKIWEKDITVLNKQTYNWNISCSSDNFENITLSDNTTFVNHLPTQSTPLLTGSDNFSSNITLLNQSTVDLDKDPVTNINNWFINGIPFASFYFPLEDKADKNNQSLIDFSTNNVVGKICQRALGYDSCNNYKLPKWNINGKFGASYYLNDNPAIGTGEYIRIEDPNMFSSPQGTISFFVKYNSTGKNTDYDIPVMKTDNSGNLIFFMWFNNYWNKLSLTMIDDAGIAHKTSQVRLKSNIWNHIAFSWGPSGMRVYVDGILKAYNSYKGSAAVSNQATKFGLSDRKTGVEQIFKANFDEIIGFDKQLKDEQISILANEGFTKIALKQRSNASWSACITPTDGQEFGSILCSNSTLIPTSTISNIQKSSSTNTTITLNWTNPQTPDFNYVQIMLDDIEYINTLNNTIVITGLAKGSLHNITLNAIDINNNIIDSKNISERPYFNCLTNIECDDGNVATIDSCSTESMDGLVCMNRPINLWGTISDEYGNPLQGEKISLIESSNISIGFNSTTGTFDSINPKSKADLITDINGRYFGFADPSKTFDMVINGSIKRDYEIESHKKENKDKKKKEEMDKDKDTIDYEGEPYVPTNFPIILPEDGTLQVLFESASAGLKSDLWIESPSNNSNIPAMIVANSKTGVSANFTGLLKGDKIVLSVFVHADAWGLPNYKHYSNESSYAIVDRVDYNTWRVRFEDLDSKYSNPDWDYNDIVALIGLDTVINKSYNESYEDCDDDGKVNWEDDDDEDCDLGEHDSEVDENSTEWSTNYNVAGHIIYSGIYENENKYTCSQKVRFVMFGRNNGNQDLNLTYYVENHNNSRKPTDAGVPCVSDGTNITYCGNDSYSSETLNLLNDGKKYSKYFDFTIPCDYPTGKYDIHVQHNQKWGNMHKIGNFFVVADTTPPGINVEPYRSGYTNETIRDIFFSAWDIPQPGTVRITQSISLLGINKFNVTVDKDIKVDGPDLDLDPTNDNDLSMTGGYPFFNLTYNKSGHYTAKVTAYDPAGNSISKNISIDVFITEEEAKDIAWNLYTPYFNALLGTTTGELFRDYTTTTYPYSGCGGNNMVYDIYDLGSGYNVHLEYLTPLNTDKNNQYIYNISTNSTNLDEPFYNGANGAKMLYASGCADLTNNKWRTVNVPAGHFLDVLWNMTDTEFAGNVSYYLNKKFCIENSLCP